MHRDCVVDIYSALRSIEQYVQDTLLHIAWFTLIPLSGGPSLDSPPSEILNMWFP